MVTDTGLAFRGRGIRGLWVRTMRGWASDARAPIVFCQGQLDMGRNVVVTSRPSSTHLVVGPHGHLELRDGVQIGQGVGLSCYGSIVIGEHAVIGPYTLVADSDFHVVGNPDAPPEIRPVSIGKRTRIGAHSVILPGAVLGDDVTVAPASVVSGHVRSGQTVAGNPADVVTSAQSGAPRALSLLVTELFGLDAPATPETAVSDLPGWDSLAALRLLLTIEAEYHVIIDERQLSTLLTVGDWISTVATSSQGGVVSNEPQHSLQQAPHVIGSAC